MKIKLATFFEADKIIEFFEKYLDKEDPAITGREFFCPFGIKAAVQRNQVMVVLDGDEILGAVRFYPRKRDGVVSVYQFAIAKNYRGQNLLKKMLEKTRHKKFEVLCPINDIFNEYYKKTDWVKEKFDEKYNYWVLEF